MRASKLLGQLTIYYLVIAGIVIAAMQLWPGMRGYLPIGGVEQLISQPAKTRLRPPKRSARRMSAISARACSGWLSR